MRILVVQESDWIAKGPHQSHHLFERLAQKGHEIHVIDYPIDWRKAPIKKPLVMIKQVFTSVHKVVGNGVTVIRPGIVQLPFFSYASLIVTGWKSLGRLMNSSRTLSSASASSMHDWPRPRPATITYHSCTT